MTIKRWLGCCALLLALGLSAGCSGSEEVVSGTDHPKLKEGRWFPLWWGGEKVGFGMFEVDIMRLSANDVVPITTITEEITYRGDRYIFEFVLVDKLSKMTIKRYDQEEQKFLAGDSYTMTLEDNILTHLYYDNNGQKITNERQIMDYQKVQYTEQLFKEVAEDLNQLYGYYIYEGTTHRTFKRMRSIGYDLLNYDKI